LWAQCLGISRESLRASKRFSQILECGSLRLVRHSAETGSTLHKTDNPRPKNGLLQVKNLSVLV
jgi:hypothetical protein